MKKPAKVYVQKLGTDSRIITKLQALQQSQELNTIANLLLECVLTESSLKQASILKKISPVISELDDTSFSTCVHVLAQIFVDFDYKNPARRALSSLFDSLHGSQYNASLDSLASVVMNRLVKVQNDIGLTEWDPRPAIDVVLSLMENFKLGNHVIEQSGVQVLRCLSIYLKQLVQNTRLVTNPINCTLLMNNCLAAIKTIIAVIQKSYKQLQIQPSCVCFFENISTELVVVLNKDFLPDCQTASGMALCLIICVITKQDNNCNQLILETFFQHYIRSQNIAHQTENPKWMSQVLSKQEWQAPLSFAHLCICHGILTMAPWEELIKPLDYPKLRNQTLLFDVILSDLCLLCKSLKEPFPCLTAYKVLTLWAEQVRNSTSDGTSPALLTQVHGPNPIPQKLLSFVWDNLEHPIEIIRYQVKGIFDHVVNMHVVSSGQDPSNDNFLKDLSLKLLQMGWHIRGIYGPLCCLTKVTGAKSLLAWHPCIPQQLMEMLKDNITAPHAIDFVDIITKTHMHELTSSGEDMDFWLKTWVVPVISLLGHQGSIQGSVHIEKTLAKLLLCYPKSLQFIVNNLQNHYSNENIRILITCLKIARTMGQIKANENQSKAETWGGVVPVTWLEKALCHIEEQLRLDALGLLCECPRTTEPVSMADLTLLKVFFPLNLNNQSPSFRQQCTRNVKKLLMRMKECLRISAKRLDKFKDDELHSNRLKTYKEFLHWFSNLLFASLFPGASFARRTTALNLLKLLNAIFVNDQKDERCEPFIFNDVVTQTNVRPLVDCLHDNYDANKVLAYEILKSCPDNTLPFQTMETLKIWLQRLDMLLSSPRAVDATTASVILKLLIDKCFLGLYLQSSTSDDKGTMEIRGIHGVESQTYRVLCHLLDTLDTQRGIAEQSLNQAASRAPMHNTLHCLREVLGHLSLSKCSIESMWQKLVSRLLDECLYVASLVSPVVTCSSPEGHMIDDDCSEFWDGAEEGIFNPSSQILLVCCWRTMKEVALLLGDLVQSAPIKTDETMSGLLTSEQVCGIGKFFTTVLLTSKHHGAFELAYSGFIKLCSTLWTCNDSSLQGLPRHWLESLLSDIRGCAPSDVLCGTRRSAGIPFFVQAIVTTEPMASGKASFKHLMNELVTIASQPITTNVSKDSTLPQVHARNILRALYRDTRLGEDICQFVSSGIKVAINGFLSDSWAVRNSSTLLFSALMTRIFGVKKSKDEHSRRNCMTGREFFTRFPELHSFLVDQLRQCTEAIDKPPTINLHPSLYPVLVLLSRLYPSTFDGADSTLNMSAFMPFVIRCGGSSVLKTRSMAARAIVPLASAESMFQIIKELFLSLPKSSSKANQNKMHGALLQIQHIIKHHLVQSTATNIVKGMVANSVLPMLESVLWIATRSNPCDVTRAVFLDITLELVVNPDLEDKKAKKEFLSYVDNITRIQKIVTQTAFVEVINESPKPRMSIGVSLLKEICARISLGSVKHSRKSEDKSIPTDLSLSRTYDDVNLDSRPLPMSHCSVVCSLLSSCEYEVRLAALQHLDTCLMLHNPRQSHIQECGKSSDVKKGYIDFDGEDLAKIALILLEMAMGKEHHLDCLVQVYHSLSLVVNYLTFPCCSSSGKAVSVFECWRFFLMQAGHPSKLRDGIMCSLLDLLSKLANSIYEAYSLPSTDKAPIQLSTFHDFSLVLKSTSKEDASFEVRLKTATILSGGDLDTLLWDPFTLLGAFPLELWKVIVNLLHDDDSDIRDCVARVVLKTHETQTEDLYFPTSTLAIQNVLSAIYNHFYRREPRVTLQWMLGWIVDYDIAIVKHSKACCDHKQSEIDFLFDKNSLNSYQERVVIAQCAFQCLNDASSKAGNNDVTSFPSDAACDVTSDVNRYQNHMLGDVARKCIYRLQGIVTEPDASDHHFLDIFSNLLGLIVTGCLMTNPEINTVVNRRDEEALKEKLILDQEKTRPTSKLIKELILKLKTHVKLMDLFCHPIMTDCVRDLCEIYNITHIKL